MTRIGITIGVALTVGIAIGVVLMWTISPPESNSGLHKDAETIYCAAPANKVSLRNAMAELGTGTSYQRACNALVELSDPALENSSSPPLTWQNILLGSSVLAALVTAVFNWRSTTVAARKTRIDSFTDAAFAAFTEFNREALEYVGIVKAQSRPSRDNIDKCYKNLSNSLKRLPKGAMREAARSARECHGSLVELPTGPDAGKSGSLAEVEEKLSRLSESMGELQSRLLGTTDLARRGEH